MKKKKLTKQIWYDSDTMIDPETGEVVPAPPPVAVNDGSKSWHLNGLTRGELFLNDYHGRPTLFVLGSDNQVKEIVGGSGGTGEIFWELVKNDPEGQTLSFPYIQTVYDAVINKKDAYLQIGSIRLQEDIENNSIKVIRADGNSANLYTTGGLSALGLSDTKPSPGGGGLNRVYESGSGNAYTSFSYTNNELELIKGTRFTSWTEFTSHSNNSTIHVTGDDKTKWDLASYYSHTHSNKNYLDVINQNLSTSSSPTFASYVQIGSIRLVYESSTNSLKVQLSNGNAANLYTTGGLSALGYSGTSGGAISWDNIAGKPSWIGSAKPSYSWNEITNKPNVLSSISQSGSGNVVTSVTYSGSIVTVTKGAFEATLPNPYTATSGWKVGGSGDLWVGFSGGNTIRGLSGNSIGNLYINYISSSVYVRVDNAGNGYYTGSWTKASDIRLKKDIVPLDNVCEKLKSIIPFYYTPIGGGKRQIGYSAQEVMKPFPEVVSMFDDEYYGVDYPSMPSINTAAIKELCVKYETLYEEHLALKEEFQKYKHKSA